MPCRDPWIMAKLAIELGAIPLIGDVRDSIHGHLCCILAIKDVRKMNCIVLSLFCDLISG